MQIENEKKLVARILAGENDAFETLVSLYERRIFAMALRTVHNEQDAMDLCQEVFLKIYKSLPLFRFQSSLATWIYHLTSNLCIDFLRARKVRPQTESLSSEDEDLPAREIPDERWAPERCTEQIASREALNEGLRRLSPQHREILLLREMNGLSYEEIGERLHLPTGTVKSRIARARESLRGYLVNNGNFFSQDASKLPEHSKGDPQYVKL